MATNYQIKLYQYDELSDAAKDNAARRWDTYEQRQTFVRYEYDEIGAALDSFRKLMPLGNGYSYDQGDNLFFYGVGEKAFEVEFDYLPDCLTTGDCYGCDIATAWNAHVQQLKMLQTAYNALDEFQQITDAPGKAFNSAFSTIALRFTEEINAALADVAKTVNRAYSDAYETYHDPQYMHNLFEYGYARDNVYTVDGLAFDPDKYGMTETA